jgi:hypothetical protein
MPDIQSFCLISITNLDMPMRCHWCGDDATKLVSRTSTLTGNQYGDPACLRCAGRWEVPA